MLETFIVTIKQMAILFLFIGFGFFMARRKMLNTDASNVLSKICVNLFVPAIGFSTMIKYCRPEVLKQYGGMFFQGLIMMAVTAAFAFGFAYITAKDKSTRGIYVYALTCPNFGYIGYPVVTAIMGEAALFPFMIFTLPFSLFAYSVGVAVLTPQRKFSLKGLLNPTLIATILGIIFGITGVADYIPDFLTKFVSLSGDCMTPVGMILTGLVIGRLDLKQMFSDFKVYIVTALRLVLLPAAGILVFLLMGIRGEAAIMGTLFLCLPGGLNSIVFPEAFGGDTLSGARIVFNTNIIGIITIPIVMAIANSILSI